jgi:membrane fusion protein, multidrug efflux system
MAVALALAAGLVLAGCGKEGSAGPAGKPTGMSAPAAPVTVATALQKDVPINVRVIGTVEPYSTVTIKSRVAGQIVKVAFQEGQEVKKGDLLFQIDPRPFVASLALAKANLARDIATARNARQQAEFQADIFKRNAGTQRELDQALAMADAAEAQVEADRAAIQSTQVQLDYCTICSPLDGRTGDLMVHEGSVVKNDDTSLITINQLVPIYVSFAAAEKYLPQIRRYMIAGGKPLAVDVTFPQDVSGEQGPARSGDLTFVDNQVDKTTGMIQLKGTFSNQDRALWPGQFVNVALVLTRLTDAVVVPAQAVQTSQQGRFVFVVRADNTVESRPVTTGVTWGDLTVIEKGVAANDRVVTDGHLRLAPGAKVSIKDGATTRPAI